MANQALEQTRDSVLRCGWRDEQELLELNRSSSMKPHRVALLAALAVGAVVAAVAAKFLPGL